MHFAYFCSIIVYGFAQLRQNGRELTLLILTLVVPRYISHLYSENSPVVRPIFSWIMYGLDHVARWEPYSVHDLAHVSWIGSVMFR